MRRKQTKIQFEEILNEKIKLESKLDSKWVIKGAYRYSPALKDRFGTALRRYDPERFQQLFIQHLDGSLWDGSGKKEREQKVRITKEMILPLDNLSRNIDKLIQLI